MSVLKILALVRSCGECPHYKYYSGGAYECSLVKEIVRNKNEVAPFCPLTEYPAHTIAGMQTTIESLREPHKYSFILTLMAHVATKLKRNLDPQYRITIPFKAKGVDDRVCFDPNFILGVEHNPVSIKFGDDQRTFQLFPDSDPPVLKEEVELGDTDVWVDREISRLE